MLQSHSGFLGRDSHCLQLGWYLLQGYVHVYWPPCLMGSFLFTFCIQGACSGQEFSKMSSVTGFTHWVPSSPHICPSMYSCFCGRMCNAICSSQAKLRREKRHWRKTCLLGKQPCGIVTHMKQSSRSRYLFFHRGKLNTCFSDWVPDDLALF